MSTLSLTPSSVSSRTVVSADRFKIQPQFEEAIHNTLREAKGFHELVITNMPPGWEHFLWEVEEDLPSIRKTYNPESRCLRLKIMPTYAHNCIAEWISASISRACAIDFLDLAELDLLLLQQGTKVGWSESYNDRLDDMNRLLIGGNGAIKIVILVKWTKHANKSVSGVLELYKNDRQGIPRRTQTEIIFPMPAGDPLQPLEIRRCDLNPVQSPRNPNENFPLVISRLRYHARISLVKEGYVPA
ncbi:uncharacterized protein N7443_010117 [Penicillium atrosanguineum]|uniref:Uncharacterized protein n=1 Tax=Penicillium atrosanguineum TaxID=1132637 RepID=A0A9W9PTU7_9EURO|nr:uncharacterized protein N7443_010117 [Penicillium atrosanguineum]KAJ5289864.1 hypothetical protein N7443_010117 [Penicillium atrosanguineum]KAJ5307688.1 hypothetical protein N7476_008344 [Penicillium atrosanguineum]